MLNIQKIMASKKHKKRATLEYSPSPQPRKKRKLSTGDTHDDEPAVTIKSQSKKKGNSDEMTPRQLEDLVEALRARYGAESFAQRAYRLPGRVKCCWKYLERGECRDPTCTLDILALSSASNTLVDHCQSLDTWLRLGLVDHGSASLFSRQTSFWYAPTRT